MIFHATVEKEFENYRLDQFLARFIGDDISRSTIQKWIKGKNVFKTEPKKSLKASYPVKNGDRLEIHIPPPPKNHLQPVAMDIEIIQEHQDFLFIRKPAGIACHAGPGDSKISLVNGLLHQFQQLSLTGGARRPGIVHRLDKPTSGIMLIAKNDRAHMILSGLFQKRQIYKRYYAWLLQSPVQNTGRIELPLGRHKVERMKMCVRDDGRRAVTNYRVIKTIPSRKGRYYTLVEVEIETGRTHQIRVHFQNSGCPVVGDRLYSHNSQEYEKFGLLLFAQKLRFTYPDDGCIYDVELDFPDNFTEFEKIAGFK